MDLDTKYPEVDFNPTHSSGGVSSASPSSPSALPMRTILQDVVDSEWTRLQLHFEVHFPAVRETPLGSYADLHVHECTRHLQHFLRLTERVFYESKRAILSYALDSATSSTAPPPPPPPPPGPLRQSLTAATPIFRWYNVAMWSATRAPHRPRHLGPLDTGISSPWN